MNFSLFDILLNLWSETACVAYTWAGGLVNFLLNGVNDLFRNTNVIRYEAFLSVFAEILLIVGIGFSVAQWAISATEGNPDNILNTFKNAILGLFASLGFVIIPVNLLRFTCECCQLLIQGLSINAIQEQLNDVINTDTTVTGVILYPLFCIGIFICVIKVFLGNIKRGGTLIVMLTVAPVHIFNLPRGYTDGFFSWCKQVIALCLTTFVQNFLIALSFLICASSTTVDITLLTMSLGVALAAMEAPRILQQFGLDTTLRTNAGQALMALNSISSVARNLA